MRQAPPKAKAARGRRPSSQPDDVAQARWAAVLARDKGEEDGFVYAVTTTGIYCRCSCAAKTPLRTNVVFFDTPAQASAQGYRPCKRCHPGDTAPSRKTAALIARACRTLEQTEETPSLRTLARGFNHSPHHFHRLFKSATGVTPREYWLACRNRDVQSRLKQGASITSALQNAGFGSARQFYAQADKMLGMSPTVFKKGGAGLRIHFAVGACSLGAIAVAATEKGICAVLLGDDRGSLLEELQDRFPAADLVSAGKAFEETAARVIAFADGTTSPFDLPFDIQGTAFQHRVWTALRTIPLGETASYTEIAQRIGAPAAVRAVAGACAANPVAIIVPCHRVVRSDGSLSGYRWGLARKQTLLDREKRAITGQAARSRRTT